MSIKTRAVLRCSHRAGYSLREAASKGARFQIVNLSLPALKGGAPLPLCAGALAVAPPSRQLPVYVTRSSPQVCPQWGDAKLKRVCVQSKCKYSPTACSDGLSRLEESQAAQ